MQSVEAVKGRTDCCYLAGGEDQGQLHCLSPTFSICPSTPLAALCGGKCM